MERPQEGPEPEKGTFLPIRTSFGQLAAWLGTTEDEIAAKFTLDDLVNDWGEHAGPPTLITVRSFERSDAGFAALCEIVDDRDHIVGAKVVGYLYDPGEIRVQNTGIRM